MANANVRFAHALLKLHDDFGDSCYDHEWAESLAHKLCATYVEFETALQALCTASTTIPPKPVSAAQNEAERCVCMHMQIERSCHNHVVPWTQEHGVCTGILEDAACAKLSPLAGLCAHHERMHRQRTVPLLQQQAASLQFAHTRHATQTKHSGWRAQGKAERRARWHRHTQQRLGMSKSRLNLHQDTQQTSHDAGRTTWT